MIYDIIVIGGGVTGTAVSRALAAKQPGLKILLLEKEAELALHASGRNSGVIHSGFNLAPGSFKARFCVEGNRRLKEFCRTRKVPMEEVGTIVVAVEDDEIPTLELLKQRGIKNGVPGIELIDKKQLNKLEPHCAGVAAVYSPAGAIVDSKAAVKMMANDAINAGVIFNFFHHVKHIDFTNDQYKVITDKERFTGHRLVNCAGVYADGLAHMLNVGNDYSIIPFRGDYYRLSARCSGMVKSMIYPAPNIKYPFLGIHFTKTVNGDILAGPNAVLAFGRESYSPFSINFLETFKMFSDFRFWKMVSSTEFMKLAVDNLKTTFLKSFFLKGAQRLLPELEADDISAHGRSGNRAQLVDRNGKLVEDLVIEHSGRSTHVLNAVSPGLTCSLPFSDYVADQVLIRV